MAALQTAAASATSGVRLWSSCLASPSPSSSSLPFRGGGGGRSREMVIVRAAQDSQPLFPRIKNPFGPDWKLKSGGWRKEEEEEEEEEEGRRGKQNFRLFNGGIVLRKDSLMLDAFGLDRVRRSDPRTIFVAGGLGQIGVRTTRKLLQAGFIVRAGVAELAVAQQLAEFATQYGMLSSIEAKRLNAVEFDFKDMESVGKAIGKAGKVVVTVGAMEDGPGGRVSAGDAQRVLEAAQFANVGHFILVTELGEGVGNSDDVGLLASFFTLLKGKKETLTVEQLIDQIAETNLRYTVIKAASTLSLDEIGAGAGNIEMLPEGSADPSAKVGKQQVADVVESAFSNSTLSENKVVELVSSLDAKAKPIEELFRTIAEDDRRFRKAEALATAKAEQAELEARLQAEAKAFEAAEEARIASQIAAELRAEARKLAEEESKAGAMAAKAQAKAAAAAASLEEISNKAKQLGAAVSKNYLQRKEGVNLPSFLATFSKDALPSPAPSSFSSSPSPPVEAKFPRQLLRNLWQQETIYVDEE